ncbi:MAG: VWA domain-containing protein [Planctomycetes bacterium]|nr:VWA domain-containing protein [Planctomycetota bacterium]
MLIDFQSPWYLLLLLLIPALCALSYRRLAVLGPVRRLVVLGLRSLLVLLIALALADIQWVRRTERLAVIFLVDQSLSIPQNHRQTMREYVDEAIKKHRPELGGDLAGMIEFARTAEPVVAPHDDVVFVPDVSEVALDRHYTNLAAAMRMAKSLFPADAAKRIVIITDGNENMGDALAQAEDLRSAGISIDVVPIRYPFSRDVAVEKVVLPGGIRKGQPFDLRVVLTNSAIATDDDDGVVVGQLRIHRIANGQPELRADQRIEVPPGKRVFRIRETIQRPNFYTYEATFDPDRPDGSRVQNNLAVAQSNDAVVQNNQASAFTHVAGSGRVLLIENKDHLGRFDDVARRLGERNIEVIPMPSDKAFRSLADLQQYDSIILADVPREHFSDEQIKMLVRNTQQMGAGLIMMGGQDSFGSGGWTNTELEKAMPIDFQIKNTKIAPVGALVMIMHASEMARGNHWQKVIAKEAIKTMGSQDYCGVLHWNGNDAWLWGGMRKVGPFRKLMLKRIAVMQPGDMPQFDPAMRMAVTAFAGLKDTAVRHMIIISDGDPSVPTPATIQALKNLKVTVSTMAVGSHGMFGSQALQDIADQTGGTYYIVTDPRALPRYYQKEARRVAQPLMKKLDPPLRPLRESAHEILKGIEGELPPLAGFVMSTRKESSLAETLLYSPLPADKNYTTVLAAWNYGLGRTVAFTSDGGDEWARAWRGWSDYDRFLGQMVRWSMRPTGEMGDFTISSEVRGGKVNVVVTALDKNDEFLNLLELEGTVLDPSLGDLAIQFRQVAPGRYIGSFDVTESGSYLINVRDATGDITGRTGVNVPYSAEFRQRRTNEVLLANIAGLAPEGAEPGRLIEDPSGRNNPRASLPALLETNVFRHDLPQASSSQDVWHLLMLIGCCVFFGDVLMRRVHIHFLWLLPMLAAARDRVLRREAVAQPDEYMERLRSRKAEVTERIESRRATTRFEAADDAADSSADPTVLTEMVDRPGTPAKPQAGLAPGEAHDDESYTSRLLKAKKKVWEDRDRDKK